jgi:PTH1 family peptidyl-tRNA hydrolase
VHLVVGLGNPGPKYHGTRHNLGFDVVERLADGMPWRDEFDGRYAKGRWGDADVVLLRPMTFMNRSGQSARKAMDFFGVPLERTLVIHDELDLPLGVVRLKRGGGLGGHNGLKSVAQHAGGRDFPRVRVGIGRPPFGEVTPWVLGRFDEAESAAVEDVLDLAARAARCFVAEGMDAAMRTIHPLS